VLGSATREPDSAASTSLAGDSNPRRLSTWIARSRTMILRSGAMPATPLARVWSAFSWSVVPDDEVRAANPDSTSSASIGSVLVPFGGTGRAAGESNCAAGVFCIWRVG
jgi:hypothetical protein